MPRLSDIKRIVIKVGTNTLFTKNKLDLAYINDLARQIVELQKESYQILFVTSGAVGMGANALRIVEKPNASQRYACAAIGQPLLMHQYHAAFAKRKVLVSQLLLTYDMLDPQNASSFFSTVKALIDFKVVPIFNGNDAIATPQTIKTLGDNDHLAALLATSFNADLLIILTDIDGFYHQDPHKNPDAIKIPLVTQITSDMIAKAEGSGSTFSIGGMKTKLQAAKIATESGCITILAYGREKNILTRIISGEELGTTFLPLPIRHSPLL